MFHIQISDKMREKIDHCLFNCDYALPQKMPDAIFCISITCIK